MPLIYRAMLFTAIFLLTSAYALGRGGRPERIASGLMFGGAMTTSLIIAPFVRRYHGVDIGVAVIDTVMLAGFVWLALRADRFWPLWMAAMQAVIVLIHLSVSLKAFIVPNYYKNTTQLWSYPQIALLAVGTLRHRLRTRPSRLEARLGRAAVALRRLLERGRSRAANRGAAARD